MQETGCRMHEAGAGTGEKAWPVKWLILLFLLVCLLWGLVSPRSPELAVQATIKRSSSAIAVEADGVFLSMGL